MEAIYSNYSPTFLYIDKYHFPDKWVYQENKIPYNMFRYIYSGDAKFVVDNISYEVTQGDVFYIPQGSMLYCEAYTEIVFVSVRFISSVQVPGEDMLKQLWNVRQQYHVADQPEIKDWFEKMYQIAISRSTYKRLETRGYLNLICAALAKMSTGNEESEETLQQDRKMMEAMFDMESIRRRAAISHVNNDPRIRTLVDYLTLHPEKNVTQEEMCEICDMSSSSIRRLFKQQTGKTLSDFIRETKMVYAAHQLVVTNLPISEIAYRLGYDANSYFGKIFRETYGVSPLEYRKQSRDT